MEAFISVIEASPL